LSFKQVFPHTSSFVIEKGKTLDEVYEQTINVFNEKEAVREKKRSKSVSRLIGNLDDTHFIKVYKFHKSRKQKENLEESEMYLSKPKFLGTSFTFIEIPLGSAEINADLSSYCEIMSKLNDSRIEIKSLDCLFRNLSSSSLSEAKDFLFSSYKAVRGVKTNCETKLQISLSPYRTRYRQMGSIFY
jgi:hypothetical protein